MAKGLRFSEKDLKQMMNNRHLKINDTFQKPKQQIYIDETPVEKAENPKKVNKNVGFDKICDSINDSSVEFSYNNNQLMIILYGCSLLSLNQMMAYLQVKPQPFHMMRYKKIWHNKMSQIVESIVIDSISERKTLPDFHNLSENETLHLELYRQAKKMIDEDSIASSFKYIIDGLRQDVFVGGQEYRLFNDDNQQNISSIIPYQVKSNKENIIAIRIKKINNHKRIQSINDFKML